MPFILFQLSYELRKTAQDVIFRSSPSDTLGLLVLRLVLPSRVVSRSLSSSWWSLVAGVGSYGSARWRLVVAEASFVCPAAWQCACPHPSPAVSSASRRVISFIVSLLVSHVLRAGWHCVLARLVVVLLFSWDVADRDVLPCLLVSSDCSSRVVELVVHSRLAVASRLVVSLSGEVLASHFISASSRWAAILVLPYRRRCLLVLVPSGDGAMTFSSSAFPPAPYHHMAAGSKPVMRPHLARRCLLLVPGVYRSCLVPFIRFETDGTGGGAAGYLAIGAWFIMPRR